MHKTILAVALMGMVGVAHAARIEVGLGVERGIRDANGFWYQQGNPYAMHLDNITGYIGVTGRPWRYLGWHADYVYLGSYSVNSWDETDAAYQAGCRGSGCLGGYYHFKGHGFMQGVRLTVGPTIRVGHWHLSAQLGPFIYRATYTVTYEQTTWPAPLTVSHSPRFQVGDVVGMSLRDRHLTAGIDEYFMNVPQDRIPPLIHGAWTATLGYRF